MWRWQWVKYILLGLLSAVRPTISPLLNRFKFYPWCVCVVWFNDNLMSARFVSCSFARLPSSDIFVIDLCPAVSECTARKTNTKSSCVVLRNVVCRAVVRRHVFFFFFFYLQLIINNEKCICMTKTMYEVAVSHKRTPFPLSSLSTAITNETTFFYFWVFVFSFVLE